MDQYSRIKKQIEGLLKDSTFLISKKLYRRVYKMLDKFYIQHNVRNQLHPIDKAKILKRINYTLIKIMIKYMGHKEMKRAQRKRMPSIIDRLQQTLIEQHIVISQLMDSQYMPNDLIQFQFDHVRQQFGDQSPQADVYPNYDWIHIDVSKLISNHFKQLITALLYMGCWFKREQEYTSQYEFALSAYMFASQIRDFENSLLQAKAFLLFSGCLYEGGSTDIAWDLLQHKLKMLPSQLGMLIYKQDPNRKDLRLYIKCFTQCVLAESLYAYESSQIGRATECVQFAHYVLCNFIFNTFDDFRKSSIGICQEMIYQVIYYHKQKFHKLTKEEAELSQMVREYFYYDVKMREWFAIKHEREQQERQQRETLLNFYNERMGLKKFSIPHFINIKNTITPSQSSNQFIILSTNEPRNTPLRLRSTGKERSPLYNSTVALDLKSNKPSPQSNRQQPLYRKQRTDSDFCKASPSRTRLRSVDMSYTGRSNNESCGRSLFSSIQLPNTKGKRLERPRSNNSQQSHGKVPLSATTRNTTNSNSKNTTGNFEEFLKLQLQRSKLKKSHHTKSQESIQTIYKDDYKFDKLILKQRKKQMILGKATQSVGTSKIIAKLSGQTNQILNIELNRIKNDEFKKLYSEEQEPVDEFGIVLSQMTPTQKWRYIIFKHPETFDMKTFKSNFRFLIRPDLNETRINFKRTINEALSYQRSKEYYRNVMKEYETNLAQIRYQFNNINLKQNTQRDRGKSQQVLSSNADLAESTKGMAPIHNFADLVQKSAQKQKLSSTQFL